MHKYINTINNIKSYKKNHTNQTLRYITNNKGIISPNVIFKNTETKDF